MYFPDLSPYSYDLPRSIPDVLNVGWLDVGQPFSMGDLPSGFFKHLKRCIQLATVNPMRGFHVCNLCSPSEAKSTAVNVAGQEIWLGVPQSITIAGQEIWLGSAEIWVPCLDGTIFACPNLLAHYISAHKYLPPSQFITSVMNPTLLAGWDAETEFESRTLEAYK